MFINLAPGALRFAPMSLQELINVAKNAGFAGIDFPYQEVMDAGGPEKAAAMMADAGLKFGGCGLPVQFRTTDEALAEGLANLDEQLPVAKQLGVTNYYTFLMPGHDELDYDANFKLHTERLKQVAAKFAANDIKLALEFVGPQTLRQKFKHEFIWNIDQVLELTDAVDPAVCNVLLDAWHWYCAEHTAADITGKLKGKVGYVHVNDGYFGRDVSEQVDNERTLPTETGVIDLKTFCDALREIDYQGAVTAEPFLNELARYAPQTVADRTHACIAKMLAL